MSRHCSHCNWWILVAMRMFQGGRADKKSCRGRGCSHQVSTLDNRIVLDSDCKYPAGSFGKCLRMQRPSQSKRCLVHMLCSPACCSSHPSTILERTGSNLPLDRTSTCRCCSNHHTPCRMCGRQRAHVAGSTQIRARRRRALAPTFRICARRLLGCCWKKSIVLEPVCAQDSSRIQCSAAQQYAWRRPHNADARVCHAASACRDTE